MSSGQDSGGRSVDPFAKSEPFPDQDDQLRTYIKPRPGGRTPISRGVDAGLPRDAGPTDFAPPTHGLNKLVAIANRLLMLVAPLRATRQVADVAALRQSLAQGVRDFAAEAATAGITPDRVMAARYILCTMLDEAASDTPWGGSGVWGRHSLLAMFHNETEGGEKVFQLMARLAEKPAVNLDLLELIYSALSLGFEGRYRIVDNGQAQLEAIRSKLAQIIRQERGDHPQALAQHWQGQAGAARKAPGWLPVLASGAVVATFLTVLFLALYFSLEAYSDPVYAQIQSLQVAAPVIAPAAPAPVPRLAQFLQSDIKAGTVEVRDEVDRSVVTVRGDGVFAAGSASLVPEREALMGRVGDAIAQLPGDVLVTGHTDNQPVARTARFPSNYHLSEERARTVKEVLVAHRVTDDRIRAEGRADSEPVRPNDTPANRALNRRVEVTLFVKRLGDSSAPRPAPQAGAR